MHKRLLLPACDPLLELQTLLPDLSAMRMPLIERVEQRPYDHAERHAPCHPHARGTAAVSKQRKQRHRHAGAQLQRQRLKGRRGKLRQQRKLHGPHRERRRQPFHARLSIWRHIRQRRRHIARERKRTVRGHEPGTDDHAHGEQVDDIARLQLDLTCAALIHISPIGAAQILQEQRTVCTA